MHPRPSPDALAASDRPPVDFVVAVSPQEADAFTSPFLDDDRPVLVVRPGQAPVALAQVASAVEGDRVWIVGRAALGTIPPEDFAAFSAAGLPKPQRLAHAPIPGVPAS